MDKNTTEFDYYYKKYFKKLFNYVYARVSCFQDAEDIVAEVMLGLWEDFESITNEKHLSGWLFRVTSNKLNDYLRRKYRFETVAFSEQLFEQEIEETNPKLGKNIIRELIEDLNERDKLFFQLRFQINLSFNQIAAKLNVAVNNSKVIQNRLIKKLKQAWIKKQLQQ